MITLLRARKHHILLAIHSHICNTSRSDFIFSNGFCLFSLFFLYSFHYFVFHPLLPILFVSGRRGRRAARAAIAERGAAVGDGSRWRPLAAAHRTRDGLARDRVRIEAVRQTTRID